MTAKTFLTDMARGSIDERPQLIFALHHPHNFRNAGLPQQKRHNRTDKLSDEMLTPEGEQQVEQMALYLGYIALQGSLPPTHPLPAGVTNRNVVSGSITEIIPHMPGTARCYIGARHIADLLSGVSALAERQVAIGDCSIYQGADYGLRGPDMGAMDGLTSAEILAAYPELAWSRLNWLAANRDPSPPYQASPYPFPPDFPGGSKIADWLQRWERALETALKLHIAQQVGQAVTMRVFVLTTSGTHVLSTYMNAPTHDNINDQGGLSRLEAPDSATGQIAAWVLSPGSPPTSLTDGFITIPTVPELPSA